LATIALAGVMAALAAGAGSAGAACGPAIGLGTGTHVACPTTPAPTAPIALSLPGYSHLVGVIEEKHSTPPAPTAASRPRRGRSSGRRAQPASRSRGLSKACRRVPTMPAVTTH